MISRDSVAKALGTAERGKNLRTLVQQLAAEGHSKAEIYQALEQFLIELRGREAPCEADEDAILDVMDALTGWCHPDAQLLPEK
jgi:hypothetical protein